LPDERVSLHTRDKRIADDDDSIVKLLQFFFIDRNTQILLDNRDHLVNIIYKIYRYVVLFFF